MGATPWGRACRLELTLAHEHTPYARTQGSAQFVSNVLCARFILGEAVTPRIITGTVVIILGQVGGWLRCAQSLLVVE